MFGTPPASLEFREDPILSSPNVAMALTIVGGVAMFLFGLFLYVANTSCVSYEPGPVEQCAGGVIAAALFTIFGLAVIVLGIAFYAAPRFHLELGMGVMVIGVMAPLLSLFLASTEVATLLAPIGVVLLFPSVAGVLAIVAQPRGEEPGYARPTPVWSEPPPAAPPLHACRGCGSADQLPDARFCSHCGAKLE